MRKPGSGACRRPRRPEGSAIILIFARGGKFMEPFAFSIAPGLLCIVTMGSCWYTALSRPKINDAGGLRLCRLPACPAKTIIMRKPGSGACRRTRRPEGYDIILIFARGGNLIEHHCACAPIPLRFGPQIRSLFIEYGIVLIVVEMPIALHQAEALQGCIGKAVHLWTHRIVDRPPNSFSSEIGRASCRERVCKYV